MKNIFVIVNCIILANASIGQTLAEWVQQKQTQKLYLLQQIAALQVYLNYAKKGYDIAYKGIKTIRNIKNGDYDLHHDFIVALYNINPEIARYGRVADIIACQSRIINKAKKTIQKINGEKQYSIAELDYCKRVFDDLLAECSKNIDELVMVISPGKVEMNDEERLQRINKIYIEMLDKYAFCSSFSDEINLLAAQRINETTSINRLKIISDIK